MELSGVEKIKDQSNYLRGTIKESLADELTGAIRDDDTQLIKFHGSYMQWDRDIETERKKQKLEPLFSFMIRVRVPGGVATPLQWLQMDRLSDKYGNGTIKLSTRQAFQLHGILKRNLKTTIKGMNSALLDSIAACGDVNRNVMCSANPYKSALHAEVYGLSKNISEHLLPNTTAYHEIWLDKEKVAGTSDSEPIYGKHYLPRKFKIAVAVPPDNDVDVFANDIGLIAIEEKGKLVGFNLCVGGGMGMTFGMENTYPRLASEIGYVAKDRIVKAVEEIVKIQRDNGNREDRKNARLKYTIDRLGLDWFKKELESRCAFALEPSKEYEFSTNGDTFGWMQGTNQKWFLTLFVEGGRVRDTPTFKLKSALREIAKYHDGDFRLTGNQNLVIGNVGELNKGKIESILKENKVYSTQQATALRKHAIACASLPLCGLAFAEAERYLPTLVDKIDRLLIDNKLQDEPIHVRMTGCPNGCGRPFLGEIGFVGRAPGKYNMYLGAGFIGNRLNVCTKK
ncbi:MAG: assimilatory sulfite reductase (NADPH) hemoprotein subunit [Bacteroidales bacterium]|nr:assimilatory sulfite reductase (NADPH) hemoprotein subunit [Bacteroidales bacterium]